MSEKPTPTVAECAAETFEPWPRSPDGWRPPDATEWDVIGPNLIVTVRLAFELMHKSKDELVAAMRKDADTTIGFIEPLPTMIEQLEIWRTILNAVHLRVLIAAAVVSLEKDGRL